jgi:hypothetical protein
MLTKYETDYLEWLREKLYRKLVTYKICDDIAWEYAKVEELYDI